MSRPLKEGLDYFTLDCYLDDKMQLIEAEFGLIGFAIVVKLFQKIYGEFGYYCEWNEEVALLFAQRNSVGCNTVSEVIQGALRRGIFNRQMFDEFGILTSAGIQKRYLEAAKRRSKILMDERYLLLSSPKNKLMYAETMINATRTNVSEYINSQSKVKQSKVDNIYSKSVDRPKNRFNNFPQRDMDVAAMERDLLSNG